MDLISDLRGSNPDAAVLILAQASTQRASREGRAGANEIMDKLATPSSLSAR